MNGLKVRMLSGMLALCIAAFLGGCSFTEDEEEKTNLEFTVVDEERLPEELGEMVEEKKGEAFKMTYADGGYLYLCIGYGKQETGGYSITVDDLYATENAIYLDTNLIGPKDVSQKGNQPSYPYIVVKTPFMDKTVVFD
ncbi:MAG: protease complex subunit PrcB family protein [Lachnospiraceae bacterium]|nr:protease complex subunit PrcB family protein [Lachnospiraceae bacterium]